MSSLRIIRINPLERAEEIKDLFRAHDRPEFPGFFDRAYPGAVRSGAVSWIGVDADGRVLMHIARFRRHFALGPHTVVGGLIVNLMVAASHRTFLPAFNLMRQVIADSTADGNIDFLYGDPNPPAAALLRTAGFVTVGAIRRFVLPLAGNTWYEDAAVQLYRSMLRLRGRTRPLSVVESSAQDVNANDVERPPGHASSLRPFRPAQLYEERLAGYPGGSDHWFTFHGNGRSAPPAATIFVRGHPDRLAQLLCLAREPQVPLDTVVPSLTAALRRAGYRRLWVSTLSGTHFARELTRAGFLPRRDTAPVMARAITARGNDVLRSAATWEITDLDCDR